LNIKFGKIGSGNLKLVHTLNDTAIATSRPMVAIFENFQNEDGSVDIPKVLWPYMNGKKKILPNK
jgi:seryl-tRNA synthetase